jgi:hypothetical protein
MNSYPKKKQTELTTERRMQLVSVATMNVPTLRQKYLEVFGEEPKSHNAAYLRKRIVWRIQEKALGGLSDRARQRLHELGQEAPYRYRGGPLASFSMAADELTASTVVIRAGASPQPSAPLAFATAPSPTAPLAPASPPAPTTPPAPPEPHAGSGAAPPAPSLASVSLSAAPVALGFGAREALAAPALGAQQAPVLGPLAPAAPTLAASLAPAPVPWPTAPASAPWPAAAPPPALPHGAGVGATSPGHLQLAATPTGPVEERDPRLPPPGTLLKRVHNGLTHTVQVLPTGFLYNGVAYASLSKLARAITGSNWNGFTFFGLTRPWKSEDAA